MTQDIKPMDRFDLEQHIQQCWSVIDDIDVLLTQIANGEGFTQSQTEEYLKSLRVIYQVKFEQMFSVLENLLKQGKLQ